MSGSATLSFWQLVTIALAPATLTLIAAVLAPLAVEICRNHKSKRDATNKNVSDLISSIFELREWWQVKRKDAILQPREIQGVESAPTQMLHTLCAIYFPQIRPLVAEVDLAIAQLNALTFDARVKQRFGENISLDEYNDVLDRFTLAVETLLRNAPNLAQGKAVDVSHHPKLLEAIDLRDAEENPAGK